MRSKFFTIFFVIFCLASMVRIHFVENVRRKVSCAWNIFFATVLSVIMDDNSNSNIFMLLTNPTFLHIFSKKKLHKQRKNILTNVSLLFQQNAPLPSPDQYFPSKPEYKFFYSLSIFIT